MTADDANLVAMRLIAFLETGIAPEGLFRDDVFCDFTVPTWRLQARGRSSVIALRLRWHPAPGSVPRWRCDSTPTGFVLEVEERWHHEDEDWYARELIRCDVDADQIATIAIYGSGDWSSQRCAEHARAVQLLRY